MSNTEKRTLEMCFSLRMINQKEEEEEDKQKKEKSY
jgi:hypothetical protein